jgi:hypothetical protein
MLSSSTKHAYGFSRLSGGGDPDSSACFAAKYLQTHGDGA